ncbi:MAG: NAD-binding protein [Thermotogota bacterium]|nr:NAD-binding protein [Thermotogota bacterium]
MRIVLIAGTEVAYHLSRRLQDKGHQITIVDKDEEFCEVLAKRLKKATIINGDGSKRHVLEQLELNVDDLFVALTPNDQNNLIACMLAKKVFKLNRPIALVNDPDNIKVFRKIGVSAVVSPTEILSRAIEDSLFREQITNLIPNSERLSMFRVEMDEDSPAVSKTLKDLELPKDSVIGAIIRSDEVIIPGGETTIEADDALIVLSDPSVQSAVFTVLLGEV